MLYLIYTETGTPVPDAGVLWYIDDLYSKHLLDGDVEAFIATDNMIYAAELRLARGAFAPNSVTVRFLDRDYVLTGTGLPDKLPLFSASLARKIRTARTESHREKLQSETGLKRAES